MRRAELTSLFIQHCTRRGLILVCFILISLQFVIYGCAYTLVHGLFDKSKVFNPENQYDVTAIHHSNVKGYKLRARDYGDVISHNSSTEDPSLAREIATGQKANPHFRCLQPGNVTVYNILYMKPPPYLKSFKNPCFTQRSVHSVTPHTLQHVYRLRCLPYFFMAGFTKCGTTDFHARLSQHALVTSGWTKEPHWWDNLHGKNSVLRSYLDMYQSATDEVAAYQLVDRYNRSYYPTIIGDFTPRLVWHGSDWRRDVLNNNHTEPRVLLPHKIRHLTPGAKVIILIRSPTHRLYSDYLDFMVRFNSDRQPPSPAHFHRLVISAVDWWSSCIAVYSEKRCVYDSPDTLPGLDSTAGTYWREQAADRLRIGLYVLFVREWLSVFQHSNFKVVVLEEYKLDPLRSLSVDVLPFLSLDPFSREEAQAIGSEGVFNSRSVRLDPSLDQPMLNMTRNILDHFYRPYNLRLFELLKRPPHTDYI